MSNISRRIQGTEQGQAIVEFLVYMVWMVPFVLLAVAIAHMLNIQSTAHEASRYVAWERLAYDGNTYNQRLSGGVNGFDQQVTTRFFVEGDKGFGDDVSDPDDRWEDWRSKRSMIDLAEGIQFTLSGDADDSSITDKHDNINREVSRGTNQAQWMDGRGGIQADSTAALRLTVPIRADEDTALGTVENLTNPRISSTYALVADSWVPGSEDNFNQRVVESRPKNLSGAREWLTNNGGARLLRNHFAEIDQRLYSDPDNPADSFSTVSPEQSTAIPLPLLDAYDESDVEDM